MFPTTIVVEALVRISISRQITRPYECKKLLRFLIGRNFRLGEFTYVSIYLQELVLSVYILHYGFQFLKYFFQPKVHT